MFERRFVALVAAVLVAAAVAAFFLLSGDGGEDEEAPGLAGAGIAAGNAAEYFDDGTDTLLYKSGTTLIEKSIDGEERKVGELDAVSVFPSPASPWIAYHSTPSGRDDRVALTLLQTEDEDEVEIENALGPVWSPDGSYVAYVDPIDPHLCLSLTRCTSDVEVKAWDLDAGEAVEVTGAGDWTILGWSGSALLLTGEDEDSITAMTLDGDEVSIDVAPDDLLAPSPDGRWLFVRREDTSALVPTGGGDEIAVDFPGFELTAAEWTHESDQLLAVASPTTPVDEPKKKKEKSEEGALAQLVTFSPEDPFPAFFEESYGVFGDLMWAPGNDFAGFGRRIGGGLAEFVYCPVGEGDCVSLMAYGEGTFPLRIQ